MQLVLSRNAKIINSYILKEKDTIYQTDIFNLYIAYNLFQRESESSKVNYLINNKQLMRRKRSNTLDSKKECNGISHENEVSHQNQTNFITINLQEGEGQKVQIEIPLIVKFSFLFDLINRNFSISSQKQVLLLKASKEIFQNFTGQVKSTELQINKKQMISIKKIAQLFNKKSQKLDLIEVLTNPTESYVYTAEQIFNSQIAEKLQKYLLLEGRPEKFNLWKQEKRVNILQTFSAENISQDSYIVQVFNPDDKLKQSQLAPTIPPKMDGNIFDVTEQMQISQETEKQSVINSPSIDKNIYFFSQKSDQLSFKKKPNNHIHIYKAILSPSRANPKWESDSNDSLEDRKLLKVIHKKNKNFSEQEKEQVEQMVIDFEMNNQSQSNRSQKRNRYMNQPFVDSPLATKPNNVEKLFQSACLSKVSYTPPSFNKSQDFFQDSEQFQFMQIDEDEKDTKIHKNFVRNENKNWKSMSLKSSIGKFRGQMPIKNMKDINFDMSNMASSSQSEDD